MATRKQIIYRRRRAALMAIIASLIITTTIILLTTIKVNKDDDELAINAQTVTQSAEPVNTTVEEVKPSTAYPTVPEKVKGFSNGKEIDSEFGVLLDVANNTVIASRRGTEKVYPASLTKVMTLLVAVEHIEDYNDTFTMTYEIIKPLVDSDATRAGFKEGEECKISDLLYGAILPSGADATVALAQYVSGSEEEFVKLMNTKAQELGLKNTHFTNTSGLHNTNHYTTCLDMAVIMATAMKNDICKRVLSTYEYKTHPTTQNPEGLELKSTMFDRMYGTEVPDVKIIAGKTGYTTEAKHCLVSYAIKEDKPYVAVAMKSSGRFKPIFDTFEIYKGSLPPLKDAVITSDTKAE